MNKLTSFTSFGILPTLFAVLMTFVFANSSLPKRESFFLVLILFSIPHFLISFICHPNVRTGIRDHKKELLFASALSILLLFSLFWKTQDLKLIPILFFAVYQSWHYSLQSYGAFKYFDPAFKGLRVFFLLIGIIFLKNISFGYLELINFNSNWFYHLQAVDFRFDLALLFFTIIFFQSKSNLLKANFKALVILLIWIVWALLANNQTFYLILPALHSLQYLYFVKLKNKLDLKNLTISIILSLFVGSLLFALRNKMGSFEINILIGFIFILNCTHIFLDASAWKALDANK